MAAEALSSHGTDLDPATDSIHGVEHDRTLESLPEPVDAVRNVRLPGTSTESIWDVFLEDGYVRKVERVASVSPPQSRADIDGHGGLLSPSLCHPHIHLDKAYLLSHPRYVDLRVEHSGFQEAMELTNAAKARFEQEDLLDRGQRVIEESIAAGVTHMRAFVEVDCGVNLKCIDAGILLKRRVQTEGRCVIQLCPFAQLPLFSPTPGDDDGSVIRSLMRQALSMQDVDAVGSTPYVEADRSQMERNVDWMIDLSIEFNAHLDFHLDYNLDRNTEPLVWYVLRALQAKRWRDHTHGRTIVLGHCTRLKLFSEDEWRKLAAEIARAQLPISFVGLPTSDLFMMRTGAQPEVRGTLDVLRLIEDYDLNACLGVNNIGNAFTPHGTCDPLSLACQGVGIYQAGTQQDAVRLFECLSTRAKAAIGFGRREKTGLDIERGDAADFVLMKGHRDPKRHWWTRKSVQEAVFFYEDCGSRRTILRGKSTTLDTQP